MMIWFARIILHAVGWKMEGQPPAIAKYLVIAAPHTSNWDFFFMALLGMAMGVRFRWAGKASLFRPPFGPLLRLLGGVPIDRGGNLGLVEQLAEHFRRNKRMVLAIAPEGTRHRTAGWRSGFYYVAQAAGVPIVCGFLDYRRRVGGLGPTLAPSGDIAADMAQFHAFYSGITALYPQQTSPVTLLPDQGGMSRRG